MNQDVITIAQNLKDLKDFLQDNIQTSALVTKPVRLSGQKQWYLQDGFLRHSTGGFFHVAGLRNRKTAEEHLILCQPQSALTGLILHRHEGQAYVLLQARVEPGNSGIGQYGPTIQSTPANYYKLHGGKQTPFLEHFIKPRSDVRQIAVSMQYDLGLKYYQKSKTHQYMDAPEFLVTSGNMIWVAWSAILDALKEDNFFNADLRCLLGIFDWNSYMGYDRPVESVHSLPPLLNDYYSQKTAVDSDWKLTAIEDLNGWEINEEGIVPTNGIGESVKWYETSCTTREVGAWVQPLMVADNSGHIILYIKQVDGIYFALLSVKQEIGIAHQAVILPSSVTYPGQPRKQSGQQLDIVQIHACFTQSDEGGRFYKHESLYEILEVHDLKPEQHQHWISMDALKQLYKTSDVISFQLRALGASLLPLLNPDMD